MNADFKATVFFMSTEDGGRQSPTPPMRLGCILVVNGENHDCWLMLANQESIAPGQTARVPVKLLDPEIAKPKLGVGTRFALRDTRVFAHGVVDEVFDCSA